MRFQIDEQREELKKRKDEIALAMIDETKQKRRKLFKNSKKSLFETESFDETKSHEDKLIRTAVPNRGSARRSQGLRRDV